MANTKKYRSPVKALSVFFGVIVVLIAAGIGVLLFFAFSTLSPYAQTVNKKIQQVEQLEVGYNKLQAGALSGKVGLFFTPSATFQDTVERDIRKYASLTSIEVSAVKTNNSNSSLDVTVAKPAPYLNILQFISAIENNLPNLSIQHLTLEKSTSRILQNTLIVSQLTISVSVKDIK